MEPQQIETSPERFSTNRGEEFIPSVNKAFKAWARRRKIDTSLDFNGRKPGRPRKEKSE